MDKLSYAVGVLIAQNLKKQGLTKVTSEDLASGVEDVIGGNNLKISIQEANRVLEAHMRSQVSSKGVKNLEEGKKYLQENALREEVTVLPSGLQYQVLKTGIGNSPKVNDKVTTHYEGTLIDGTVFDSSYKRGEPASFPVNGVILGWQEALQLMKVGSKWRLSIPHHLAYGEQGAGQAIPPYSTLVFDVELLKIN